LQLSNSLGNRKIVLYDAFNNDNQYHGFGVTFDGVVGRLRYQVDNAGAEHAFYAGTSPTTSAWLFTIKGNGDAVVSGTLFQMSDVNLKKNLSPITSALNELLQLNAYRYQWKKIGRESCRERYIILMEWITYIYNMIY